MNFASDGARRVLDLIEPRVVVEIEQAGRRAGFSLVEVVIALTVSISAAFWTGTACYALAVGAFALAVRES